ncbi:MAG: putative 4-hydroxybenzoate polyprenyltransferase [Thermoguttaceae bacterium]|nr:putative 4-hydroxybenzoate polyprenyltransferase [Thermoguttaceae bacterium]MDW8038819.1 4-hydroxybenzoate octaprenyltransferase [Thermoguttaceae bacterium]
MFRKLRDFLELIRFSHTLFAMPFALLSAAMAWADGVRADPPVRFRWQDLVGLLLCMVTARSAAMAFNRLADRHLDALNPRTANRHLVTGRLTPAGVWAFTIFCSLGFVASTALFLPNRWPIYGAVPVLLFLFGYSYTKRFTVLSHFWLGAALMLAPIAAWVAIRAEWAWAPVVLGAAVLLWVAGFDILYACQDVEFDRRMHLYSIPAHFGVPAALQLAKLCHAAMVLLLIGLPAVFPLFGQIFYTGLLIIGTLLAYEHAIVRPDDLSRVNQAFFHVNAVVGLGLLAVGLADLWW